MHKSYTSTSSTGILTFQCSVLVFDFFKTLVLTLFMNFKCPYASEITRKTLMHFSSMSAAKCFKFWRDEGHISRENISGVYILFCSLISVKHNFQGSCENSYFFWKFMLQIVYFVIKIILFDEYPVLLSYKTLSFKYNVLETTSDPRVSYLHFFSQKGLGRRKLAEQFFECL